MESLQQLKTVCRDCVFAVYNDKTQTGCSINQLEKLEQSGGKIVEAYDQYGQEFYIVEGRICMWARSRAWAKDKKEKDYVTKARKEMQIPYQIIIIANDNLNDIKTTVKSAVQQTILPRHITVVRYADNKLLPSKIIPILKSVCEPKGIVWRSQNSIDSPELVVDEIVSFVPHPYYAIFHAGFKIPKNTFEELDKKINDDLLKFGLILPNKDGNGYIAPGPIHRYYSGNFEKSLEEKLREDKCQNMIYQINSLLTFFPE